MTIRFQTNGDIIRITEHAGGAYGSMTRTDSRVAQGTTDAGTGRSSADEEEANMLLLLRPLRLSVEVYGIGVFDSSLDRRRYMPKPA